MALRRIKKARWPDSILQFPLGLDTFHPEGEPMPNALQVLENAEGTQVGAWQTRRGRSLLLTLPDTAKPAQGLYELSLIDGTTYLLIVQNGRLYREQNGSTVEVPIRKYAPYPPYPDDSEDVGTLIAAGERLYGSPLHGAVVRTEGAVGANLVGLRTYRYACHGVDASGSTPLSEVTDTMEVTTGATPHPVDVTWHGCWGMTSYTIWRSESGDGGLTWTAWGQMATGVTHATVDGKTLVQWADTGITVPDTTKTTPSSNTTVHVLPDDQRVDFETWDGSWNGENAAYFCNGDGLVRTNGVQAEIVTPTDPSTYLEVSDVGPGINALGDVTWPGHTARGLIRHHAYLFVGDITDKPNVFYYSRALDGGHFPQLAAVEIPAHGGRILDFKVVDTRLGVGTTTGFGALMGTVFNPLGPDAGVYYSEASSVGIASEWSMDRNRSGFLQFVSQDRRLIAITNLHEDKDRNRPIEVGESIRPTLDELTDHANAAGLWAEDQWMVSFPADQKMVRLYQREVNGGLLTAPVMDTGTALGAMLRRRDGTIIGAHATMGYVYKLFADGVYTDNGNAFTTRLQTRKLDGGDPNRNKKLRWMRVHYQGIGQITLHYRVETEEAVVESSVLLTGTGGYDEGLYDVATYDPWNAPFEEIDIGEEGYHFQVTLWWSGGFLRIHGLSFELDYKR